MGFKLQDHVLKIFLSYLNVRNFYYYYYYYLLLLLLLLLLLSLLFSN